MVSKRLSLQLCLDSVDLILTHENSVPDFEAAMRNLTSVLNWPDTNVFLKHVRGLVQKCKRDEFKDSALSLIGRLAAECVAKHMKKYNSTSETAAADTVAPPGGPAADALTPPDR